MFRKLSAELDPVFRKLSAELDPVFPKLSAELDPVFPKLSAELDPVFRKLSAELDPVFRKLWENGAKDELPRAEAWLHLRPPRAGNSADGTWHASNGPTGLASGPAAERTGPLGPVARQGDVPTVTGSVFSEYD